MVLQLHVRKRGGINDKTSTPTEGEIANSGLQKAADNLSKYDRSRNFQTPGVGQTCLFFDAPVYRHSHTKEEGEKLSVELAKAANDTKYKSVIQTLESWAGENRTSMWISDTLPVDLNLPMSSRVPDFVSVQAFVLAVGSPSILLTVYKPDGAHPEDERKQKEEKGKEDAFDFTVETVRLFTRYLHRFGHCDFVLLPCAMCSNSFTVDTLRAEVQEQLQFSRCYFDGPETLTEETFDILRTAAFTLTSMSYVPCFLLDTHESKEWLLLLDSDWLKLLTLLVEVMTNSNGSFGLTYTPETEDKVKVAVLEVARRLSCMENVDVITDDKDIISCVEKLCEQVKKEHRGMLQLQLRTSSPSGLEGNRSETPSAYTIYLPAAETPQSDVKSAKTPSTKVASFAAEVVHSKRSV